MAAAEPTGFHFKLRNIIRKGLRGTFYDDKSLSVMPLTGGIKCSPDAEEAKVSVAFSVMPLRREAADNDRQQLASLQEHLMLAVDESGLPPHSESGKYVGVEGTLRRGIPVVVMYSSDPDTLEQVLHDGLARMQKDKVDQAFKTYRRDI